MRFRSFLGFFFGKTKLWEVKLIAARIVIIAAATVGLYLLLNSGYKQYAYFLAWLFIALVITSIGYQLVRRWRDSKVKRDMSKRE
jgi:hypothetical protein